MLKRSISGGVYALLIAGLFLLRQYVDYRIFQIFFWFICAMGTFELVRAIKDYLPKFTRITALIYGIIFTPLYCVFNYFLPSFNNAWLIPLNLVLIFAVINTIYCLAGGKNLKELGLSLFPLVYPALLIFTMSLINDMELMKGFYGLLLIFVVAPLTDVFAYLVGMTYSKIKKGNVKKLCPNLSPNKTVAGAIGGLIGGALGGLLIYLIFNPQMGFVSPLFFFFVVGVVASVLTQAGDLFESFIKRKVGLKDMGKIMPGHGGVLDRIDGMMFASAFVWLIFLFV